MIRTGLVSVTFRELSPDEIVDVSLKAGLEGIEWGGDVHVPHGEIDVACRVRDLTRPAGLRIPSYGSYYRVGESEAVSFDLVLRTGLELGAPVIRVWAGGRGSADADADYRRLVMDDSRRIAGLAAKEGVRIAYEYHCNTLTDTVESAQELLRAVDDERIMTYWQKTSGRSPDECAAGLRAVLPRLCHLHVGCWVTESGERLLLSEGEAEWRAYLGVAAELDREMFAMIEFVKDGSVQALERDAATLRDLVRDANG